MVENSANSGIPEHATVRCPEVRWHERAHGLMASMGLYRLDGLSLSTDHCVRRLLPWALIIRLYSRLRELGW